MDNDDFVKWIVVAILFLFMFIVIFGNIYGQNFEIKSVQETLGKLTKAFEGIF